MESLTERRSRISLWLLRLFGYDGALPAVVLLIPATLHLLFRDATWVELLALILPIAAYIVRAGIGLEMIESNPCGRWQRRTQKTALFFALLALMVVDAVAILVCTLPKGGFTSFDFLVLTLVYLLYLTLMAIATFPCSIAQTG